MQANSATVLVLNTGSSSIKFCLYSMTEEKLLLTGTLERIGDIDTRCVHQVFTTEGETKEHIENLPTADLDGYLNHIFTLLEKTKSRLAIESLQAIGHRVVHGGELFHLPTVIDNHVIDGIRKMIPLAPLHNKACLAGIETARQQYPQVPQVAVFDTAYFQTLPPHVCHYALPTELYNRYHVRRYGFHGISHQYVATEAANYLCQPLSALKLISLHLGNGASAAAILNGKCIDTSMGMTPLEGLIMGTRCGDIDPSIPFYLNKEAGMDFVEIEKLLNNDSGIKGLCGYKDMRDVHHQANLGNEQAKLAIDMYCYRIRKYIGAYFAALGGLDALIFTAGVGENDTHIRALIGSELSALGIGIDQSRNLPETSGISEINSNSSQVKVLVIPGNEELGIARETVSVLNRI